MIPREWRVASDKWRDKPLPGVWEEGDYRDQRHRPLPRLGQAPNQEHRYYPRQLVSHDWSSKYLAYSLKTPNKGCGVVRKASRPGECGGLIADSEVRGGVKEKVAAEFLIILMAVMTI